MYKKLLAMFLIACLTSLCFLTACGKDGEAEPLEETVEETPETEEAVDDDKQAEITTTQEQGQEQELTDGTTSDTTSGADSTGVDGQFEEGEYRGDEEEDEYKEYSQMTEEERQQALIEAFGLEEYINANQQSQSQNQAHNNPEADAMLEEGGPDEEYVFGQGDYSDGAGVRVD